MVEFTDEEKQYIIHCLKMVAWLDRRTSERHLDYKEAWWMFDKDLKMNYNIVDK